MFVCLFVLLYLLLIFVQQLQKACYYFLDDIILFYRAKIYITYINYIKNAKSKPVAAAPKKLGPALPKLADSALLIAASAQEAIAKNDLQQTKEYASEYYIDES